MLHSENYPSLIHFANTDFEDELSSSSMIPLQQLRLSNPLYLQLQFLPILYADPKDEIAVSLLPPKEYLDSLLSLKYFSKGRPNFKLLKEDVGFQQKKCLSWGYSKRIFQWAQSREISYKIPIDWATLQEINSKAFSFSLNKLPVAQLLYNEYELSDWLKKHEGMKVLKTCFGLSGKGNRYVEGMVAPAEILSFCYREWKQKRPILAEPWLDRVFDFSTQWLINSNQEIIYLGATTFETNSRGVYLGTVFGPEKTLFKDELYFFLLEHKKAALKALKAILSKGYQGHIGIDAFVYRSDQQQTLCLNPLVEINARKTMSWALLSFCERHGLEEPIEMTFTHETNSCPSLLPEFLEHPNGSRIRFRHRLTLRPFTYTEPD